MILRSHSSDQAEDGFTARVERISMNGLVPLWATSEFFQRSKCDQRYDLVLTSHEDLYYQRCHSR